MLLLCLQDSERCERKSSTGSLFNFSDSRHSSPRRGSFQALGDTVVRRIDHTYVVCYVTFLNSLELTYNLVNLFFTDAALLWEVVRYPECDLCDGADRQSIIDTVIVSCLCASKKTPNICHTVNNDVLFSFFLRVFYILFKKFILFCTVKYLWQKSFLFSLILIRDKKIQIFIEKFRGSSSCMMLRVARTIGAKLWIYILCNVVSKQFSWSPGKGRTLTGLLTWWLAYVTQGHESEPSL